jgi:hypothetical protein
MQPFFPISAHRPMPRPRVLCEMLAIRLQHPPAGLLLNRSVVFLETWVALLSWLLFSAVCVEASNSLPRPVSTGLARHRIEPGCKGILFRQLSAEGLQVILAYAARIHPEPQRFVPDELRGANGFLYRGLLALVDSQLVVEYEHADPVCGQVPHEQSPAWLFEQCSEPWPSQPGDASLLQEDAGLLNVFSIKMIPPLAVRVNMRTSGGVAKGKEQC